MKTIPICNWCGDPVTLRRNGTMKPHYDIYPARLCEGGNRLIGDMRTRDEIKKQPIPPKVPVQREYDPGFC